MSSPMRRWVMHLDDFGMTDPGNREGHPEDLCNVCDRRIVDHPGHERGGLGDGSARWPHRIYAVLVRVFEHLWWQR